MTPRIGGTPAELASRVRRGARAALHPVREELRDLASVRRTAHRVPVGQTPPPPSSFAAFGAGSWVVPPAVVANPQGIVIGSRVTVLEYATLRVLARVNAQPTLVVGDGVRLARFNSVVCGVGIVIGDHVASSDSAAVFDTWTNGPSLNPQLPEPSPVVIGRNAYLGCNSTICPGVTVGEGAYVGEGAVVFDDVPDHAVVYGNPALVVRQYDPKARTWHRTES